MKHILEQGRIADQKLRQAGLCLTQGGEPTFVAAHPAAPEWNTAALGPEKLAAARKMCRQLLANLYPGGVILQSTGKHYPGEPLPRWSLGIHHSRSRGPFWKNPDLLLPSPGAPATSLAEAAWLIHSLADRLLGHTASILPAYEDVEGWMRFKDHETPSPLPKFSRSRKRFELDRPWTEKESERWIPYCEPKGWILPLEYSENRWKTAPWELPFGEDLSLLVGDSPMGLRLPLGRLPAQTIHCALTVEIRDGHLCVFLPPLPTAESFLDLVRTLEEVLTAGKCAPILLEGYPPKSGPEMESLTLVPDPGVLEVNLPPRDNWPDFEAQVRTLYEAAAAAGLRSEKHQFSGRKIPTGGGAHIILGGPSLQDNPFLKKPALLPSFLRFIQNHPCLSYVFTGLFTGPSSQAPRVDESFFGLPYELEISLRSIEAMESPASAAMLDAILRNLLLDWNGNTHRAELSIDKFANPFAPNGRLGLVEFRAFEMMPSPEMFLAPNLLLRALAACFCLEPYAAPLHDWRGQLHDRFALPHFLSADLEKVLAYLNARGFSLTPESFAPHLAFRFPRITHFAERGFEFSLRQALEPWPVLGEQPTASGTTARCVDPSTDRLEIFVRGTPLPEVSVNGWLLPLEKISDRESVGAVRYRLFDLTPSLQPQVRAHSPLVFEIIDPATQLILHAFDYHNWKPKPGFYDGLPRSDAEAAERVSERLILRPEKIGTQAKMRTPPEPRPEASALTLDLRALPHESL
ncbi:MAG: transglutaminase family protein [Verrucomicrobiae bacterium]|nr:transglutaminase family protein [Verrucomicrobiae bacterium]